MLFSATYFFVRNVRKIYRNINLGTPINRFDNKKQRWIQMTKMAFGQSKMFDKPIVGLLHLIVYLGFIIINIELLEILTDGLLGTHRVFAPYLGGFYNFLIGSFEIFAFLVLISVIIFLVRRNVLKIRRFLNPEMKGWPKNDANIILYAEILLMSLFLIMNAADYWLQLNYDNSTYINVGYFPISQFLVPLFDNFEISSVVFVERTAWWLHIIGIFVFLNYLYYSKHLHILLAFPNTYFSNLNSLGKLSNLKSVTNEVKMMMDPNSDSFAQNSSNTDIDKFGASDVFDLNKIQLLNSTHAPNVVDVPVNVQQILLEKNFHPEKS